MVAPIIVDTNVPRALRLRGYLRVRGLYVPQKKCDFVRIRRKPEIDFTRKINEFRPSGKILDRMLAMTEVWEQDDELIVDANEDAIECDDCPCCQDCINEDEETCCIPQSLTASFRDCCNDGMPPPDCFGGTCVCLDGESTTITYDSSHFFNPGTACSVTGGWYGTLPIPGSCSGSATNLDVGLVCSSCGCSLNDDLCILTSEGDDSDFTFFSSVGVNFGDADFTCSPFDTGEHVTSSGPQCGQVCIQITE